jgi:tetratricopeptide (TPR) repeat protein
MSRVASLEALADRDPTNPDLLCDLLDSLVLEGRVQRAREWLERAPQALRAMPGVVFRDARLALVEGDLPKVIALLSPLVSALQPAPAGLCHDLAYAQFTQGEPDEALRTLSRASAVEGDDVISIALLTARIWHRQQRIREALALLDGLHDQTRQAEIDGLRALLLLDHGQVSDAAREAFRALSLDPAQFEAGLVSGSLALSARREDAIPTFQRLVAMRPNAGRAYLGLGEGLMMSGDIVAAAAVLDRAVTYMPDHIGTWHALAWCQLLQGKLDDAQRSFDQAFALDRTFGETHGGRALIHALRGEREAASESIKRALRLDPQGRNARYAQSVLLLDEGREAEAQSIIQDLVASPQAGRPLVSPDFVNTLRDLLRPKQGGSRGH